MQVLNKQCQSNMTRSTIEWRRADKKPVTDMIFESCKGSAIRKHCHVNSNRDIKCRVMRDGSVRQGRVHKRPTANDMTKFERKHMKEEIIVIREKMSVELLALANKRSARFDRY